MKQRFRDPKISKAGFQRLQMINEIIEDYQNEGYTLTLRQLYYQLVSRAVIPNKASEYSKLSILLKEGRMGGIVDWSAIEDRLRIPYTPANWESPRDILEAVAQQFEMDRQAGQEVYLEVWVEKDALSGVLKRVTRKYHVPIVVNRGYSSASALYDAFQRFYDPLEEGRKVVVLYLGDFDPSGIDMIRDIEERVQEFIRGTWYDLESKHFEIKPIALSKVQINTYNPPPNPAKITDPRAKEFISRHGNQSWEVDALQPEVLHSILEHAIKSYMDIEVYEKVLSEESLGRQRLTELIDNF